MSRYSLSLLLVFISINVNAQNDYKNSSYEVQEIIDESLKNYSVDDEIINGFVYPIPDTRRKGNPYLSDQWNKAVIYVHNKRYTNCLIKYDITTDDLILKAEVEQGLQRLIELNKYQVDSFLVGSSLFVNSRYVLPNENDLIFLEQIFKGSISLYRIYSKVFIREYSDISPYGRYSDLRTNTFLFKENELIKVNNQSAFIKLFEKGQQKNIKSYIRKNKVKFKNASNIELMHLMEFCINNSPNQS